MSLNDIKLTAPLLSGLYAQVLVEKNQTTATKPGSAEAKAAASENTTAPASTEAAAPAVRFLGKNTKKVLIVVKNDALPFLDDPSLQQLTSILSACGLSLADVAVVNWAKVPVQKCEFVFDTLNNSQVLLFGVAPLEFGLSADFPHFQVQKLAGRTYVAAPALSDLINNKDLKLQLWTSLKKMFGI